MVDAAVSRGEACKMAYAKQGQEGKTRLERFQQTARDFGHFLYNKDGENGEVQVMGRNGKSWGKLIKSSREFNRSRTGILMNASCEATCRWI